MKEASLIQGNNNSTSIEPEPYEISCNDPSCIYMNNFPFEVLNSHEDTENKEHKDSEVLINVSRSVSTHVQCPLCKIGKETYNLINYYFIDCRFINKCCRGIFFGNSSS